MASAFYDRYMEYGWWKHTHTLTTMGMSMKFLPDVGIYEEAQNKHNWSSL